ncbi:SEL1-like repeat protein [Dyella jejuensis]|uniref:SEL1-like repeat protein n=1 Tax=Dyella jejuensis TaxID=1432009 RepID=A0ABW8JMW1_9GAMM
MRRLVWAIAGPLLLSMPWLAVSHAAATDAPAATSSSGSDYIPSDADLAAAHCVIGEEKFLPGDYYYCLGGLTYGKHSYRESVRFFTTAASWASKPAQYVLGVMALNGDHQPKSRALALAWFTLAAERPDSRFKTPYEQVYQASTRAERRAADVLLEKMRPTYGDATAAVRAERRYVDGMKWLARMNSGGSQYCMAGLGTLDRPVTDPLGCPSMQQVVTSVDRQAATVFEGWSGHVTVGPLQPVSASELSKTNGANRP